MYELINEFHMLTQLPIRIYQEGRLVKEFSRSNFEPNPVDMIASTISNATEPIACTLTRYQTFFGYVICDRNKHVITIGPISAFRPTLETANYYIRYMGIDPALNTALLHFLQRQPLFSTAQARHALTILDYLLNGHSQREIAYFRLEFERMEFNDETIVKDQPVIEPYYEFGDLFGKRLRTAVLLGQPNMVEAIFKEMAADFGGIPDISQDAVRSFKNIFLYACGVLSEVAKNGGLDQYVIQEVIDYYMRQVEDKGSYSEVFELLRAMFMNITNRIYLLEANATESTLVKQIKRTAAKYLNEKVSVSVIANNLHMDKAYLCRHFKANTGKTITCYINEQKIQECKRYLLTTNLSVADIAVLMGFSSSNYLIQVFKKITHTTPDLYRKQGQI